MTDEHGNGKRQTIKIPTPFGPIEIRGIHGLVTLGFSLLCVVAFALWDHTKDQERRDSIAAVERKQIMQQMEALSDRQAETTYVLTLDQPERSRLKLDMPDSLRRRVR